MRHNTVIWYNNSLFLLNSRAIDNHLIENLTKSLSKILSNNNIHFRSSIHYNIPSAIGHQYRNIGS